MSRSAQGFAFSSIVISNDVVGGTIKGSFIEPFWSDLFGISGTKTAFSPLRPWRKIWSWPEGGGCSSVDYDGSISGDPALRRKSAVSRYRHVAALLSIRTLP